MVPRKGAPCEAFRLAIYRAAKAHEKQTASKRGNELCSATKTTCSAKANHRSSGGVGLPDIQFTRAAQGQRQNETTKRKRNGCATQRLAGALSHAKRNSEGMSRFFFFP